MSDMIKAEREKIFLRKSMKILLIMGMFIVVGNFFLFHFKYNEVFYNYSTGKMEVENGFASVEHRKETGAEFQGELTSETLIKIQEKINEVKEETSDKDENSAFSAVHVAALICSFFVCFLPVLFDFTDRLPFLQKMQELCPIFMFHTNGIFATAKTYARFSQPVVMCIFNLGLSNNPSQNPVFARALKNFHFFLSGSFSFLLFSNLYLGKS